MVQHRSLSPAPRRWFWAIASRLANQQVVFAFTALAILCAKCVHIYAHWSALSWQSRQRWGYSFFAQDVGLIVLIRVLLDPRTSKPLNRFKFVLSTLTAIIICYNIAVCLISTSFYFVAGAEIHWRNVGLAGDASSRGLVLSGIFTLVIVVTGTLLLSWLLQGFGFILVGFAADLIIGFFTLAWRLLRKAPLLRTRYSQLPQQLDEEPIHKYGFSDDASSDVGSNDYDDSASTQRPLIFRLIHALLVRLRVPVSLTHVELALRTLVYMGITAALLAFFIMSMIRPKDGTLTFLSWTTALLPFVDLSSSPPSLQKINPLFTFGIAGSWDQLSALTPTEPLPWLSTDKQMEGFEDWYTSQNHYNASADPMKIDNLDAPVLPSLKGLLQDVPIKHVLLILLESTRNDVFPIKKGGMVWDRLAETWPNSTIPQEVEDKLASLTPMAKFITGDYDDGFEQNEEGPKPKRGGVRFTNAHTTATYTLKSLAGTVCGLTPLLADFDLEFNHHIYQPCLPHIFEALNNIERSDLNTSDPYATAKWQSYYFLSTVLWFDSAEILMNKMGFPENHTIGKEYLTSDEAKHGTVTLEDVNYFGFEEDPLEDYIRDAFESAKENDERVFLTHLTSTSHHPFGIPKSEEYVPLADGLEDLSHYLNAEGYVDKWLKKILDLLDEQGVADETLVVFVGDHGLSMPENDVVSTYYNPSIGNDHVPLILSHPKLPAIDIDDPVTSAQILPTILDMLLETNSLDTESYQAVTDLVRNYEGQSLIRPIQKSKLDTGNWQYTVVNPGRAMLDVRDARHPELHLVIPVVDNVEWRLSNVTEDPREQDSVQGFGFNSFLRRVKDKHGVKTAEWVEEAAFRTRWWVNENSKRWRYGLYAQKG